MSIYFSNWLKKEKGRLSPSAISFRLYTSLFSFGGDLTRQAFACHPPPPGRDYRKPSFQQRSECLIKIQSKPRHIEFPRLLTNATVLEVPPRWGRVPSLLGG